MKNSIIIKTILSGLVVALFIASCKENKPKGDEFSWSPDGKKLAMINVESKELLLVKIDENEIDQIIPIDTYSGEKAKISLSGWSSDGRYLLYAKSGKTALEILVYSLNENKTTQIDYISVDEKKGGDEKVFASWSPTRNRVLWLSWNNLAEHLLFSALPNGREKKLLIKMIGEKVFPFPAWSPNGQWIAYPVYHGDGNKNNGLWKIRHDGSENQQIFSTDEITAFQWQPDGSHLAVVQKVVFQRNKQQGKTEIKYHYQVSLVDSNGKNERLLSEEKLQIIELAWSADGKLLAFFEVQDDSRDIWVVNLSSNQKVKLNFNKVQDFFGWGNSNQLFFTIEYPENLVMQTKEEKEIRELVVSLKGYQRENYFVRSDNFKQQNLLENIYTFTPGTQNGTAAYYKSLETTSLTAELYFPIISFADGKKDYPARTRGQHIGVADEHYFDQKYQDALDQLSRYWDFDLNTADFQQKFDIEQVIEQMKTNHDSTQLYIMIAGLKDGTLLRTVMTMRKLNQKAKADWLFNQLQKLTLYIENQGQDRENILDEIVWTFVGIYGRYNELASGIADLDKFFQSEKPDSSLRAYINYAQFIMAFEDKQYDKALAKMEATLQILPEDQVELEDIVSLLSLYLGNFNENQQEMLVPILQQLIDRFPNDQHISRVYELMGDVHFKRGQQDEALAAYRSAVVREFDHHEIWDKILGIR